MKMMLLLLPLLAAGVMLATVVGCQESDGDTALPNDPAEVSINGVTWMVDLAVTPAQRDRGLGYRPALPKRVGMLFIFPESDDQKFWMQGVEFDLDIAFINEDMEVVNTARMAVEPDRRGRTYYHSEGPVRYVLEVNAGELDAAGVKPGDKVQFSADILQVVKATPAQ